MEPTADRSYSKLEWIFYIIILPVLFTLILSIILLWFLDYDLKVKILEGLNKIPYVEKLVDDRYRQQENLADLSKDELQNKIIELNKTIEEKNISIQSNEETLLNKDSEINKLSTKIKELEDKLNKKIASERLREEEITDLAKIYTNMNPKKAADIIAELNIEEAVLILGQMGSEPKSSILEKMEPKKAADLSILLKDQNYSKDQDIYALQERINLLVKEIDKLTSNQIEKVDYNQLALTYSSMDPKKAAEAIKSLFDKDANHANNLVSALDPVSRSNILNEMDPEDAAKLTIDILDE